MIIQVHVKPNARKQFLEQTGENSYKAFLMASPVDGKANEELISLIAKLLKIPKSLLRIKTGSRSRIKLIVVGNGQPSENDSK